MRPATGSFPCSPNPRYRQRLEELASVDLTRRSGCESCLRSLVMDEWTPETLHHVGWCDSCRRASIALGKIPAGPAGSTAAGARCCWYCWRAPPSPRRSRAAS